MPYALFDKDAKLSKAYPTREDVWKHAKETGLVVDKTNEEENSNPSLILDKDYEIRECDADPDENPRRNEKEAEQAAKDAPYLKS